MCQPVIRQIFGKPMTEISDNFTAPEKQCDLVMKGGITSGIVYPSAILEIAKHHRLINIGGTSAGAIAAVTAAAAEFRRQESALKNDFSGFIQLSRVPDKLGKNLIKLFQPNPEYRSFFEFALALQAKSKLKAKMEIQRKQNGSGEEIRQTKRDFKATKKEVYMILWRAIRGPLLLIFIPFLFILSWLILSNLWGWAAFFTLAFLILCARTAVKKIWSYRPQNLERQNFGLCTGLTQNDDYGHPALTNWLGDQIDGIAWGTSILNSTMRRPLLVSDLGKHEISIKAMTTDLSSARPYELPLKTGLHYFMDSEFRKLFPKYVVDYLVEVSPKTRDSRFGRLYKLPIDEAMPVLLIARMSLSFPILISTIPLYRRDHSDKDENGKSQFKRCVFSDGGISSNFPIHFFDNLLPKRPTFGISLGLLDADRNTNNDTIYLPTLPPNPGAMPITPIQSLGDFFGSILNTSKDWQDNLQSRLKGYAERIVTIRLDPKAEGGLNLNMDDTVISKLRDLGTEAGLLLSSRFDPEKHRFDRALTSISQVEMVLADFADTYSAPDINGGLDWDKLLNEHKDEKFSAIWRKSTLKTFTTSIVANGIEAGNLKEQDKAISSHEKLAVVDANLRITASADRVPQNKRNS